MVEHGKNDFEHCLKESFENLDKNIKIPEIPDAQSIFERAESRKNTIPMKKYSKYAAVAAAIVLICVSVPVVADAFTKNLADGYSSKNFAIKDAEMPSVVYDGIYDSNDIASDSAENETQDVYGDEAISENEEKILRVLEEFFNESKETKSEYYEEPSMGSDPAESDSFIIEEQFNKKRSIELVIEDDSVSVRLFDNSLGKEVISEFWVEGNYKTAALDGDNYVISIVKVIEKEDLETGFYLPMAGDKESGNYVISADDITVSKDVTYGIISMSVELNIATGEYKIYASLI